MSAAINTKTPFAAADAPRLLDELRVSQAADLALRGEYASAESLLRDLIQRTDAPVDALDLMAKVCVQQGRVAEAEGLWRRALDRAPGNTGYQAALFRLNRMQRRPVWFTILWPLALAVAALTLCVYAVRLQGERNQTEFARLEELMRSKAMAPAVGPPAAPSGPQFTQPDLQLPGVAVLPRGGQYMVRFDEGLFDHGVQFRAGARERVSRAFQALGQTQEHLAVDVVGYSDGTPGLVPRADFVIGLKRATAVAQFIGASSFFPADRLRVSSGGSEQPPFPGDSPKERAQNRTVVLLIGRGDQ